MVGVVIGTTQSGQTLTKELIIHRIFGEFTNPNILCILFIPKCFTYKLMSFFNEKFTSGRGWTVKSSSSPQLRTATLLNSADLLVCLKLGHT